MSFRPGFLVFAGSARSESSNKKLARVTARVLREVGAEPIYIDLRDYPLPLYDGDLEQREGLPFMARELRRLFRAAHGIVIASPDYNHSFSPLLKNTIDWVSRRADGEDYRPFFVDKIGGILATSPGNSGGARGLPHLRQVLSHLGVRVLERQVTIPRHSESFDAAGELVEAAHRHLVGDLALELVIAARQQFSGERAA